MKQLPWIIAGLGLGFAAYVVLNRPYPQYATGSDELDNAAARAGLWGTKQRFSGAGRNLAGRVKEGVGRVTGDDQLTGEGITDQIAGALKDTAGSTAQVVSNTIHAVNE